MSEILRTRRKFNVASWWIHPITIQWSLGTARAIWTLTRSELYIWESQQTSLTLPPLFYLLFLVFVVQRPLATMARTLLTFPGLWPRRPVVYHKLNAPEREWWEVLLETEIVPVTSGGAWWTPVVTPDVQRGRQRLRGESKMMRNDGFVCLVGGAGAGGGMGRVMFQSMFCYQMEEYDTIQLLLIWGPGWKG